MINSLAGLLAALDKTPKAIRCEGWVTFQAENSGLVTRSYDKKGNVLWSLTPQGEAEKPKPPANIAAIKKAKGEK